MPQQKIEFFAPGIPKAQPRPRAFFNRKTGHARVYDAGTAEAWKSDIAMAALPHKPDSLLTGPLCVTIEFYLPRPKYLCKKRDYPGLIRHIGRPDIDNLSKAVLDALTLLGFWQDDGQVCRHKLAKWFSAMPGQPQSQTGAFISIERLADL